MAIVFTDPDSNRRLHTLTVRDAERAVDAAQHVFGYKRIDEMKESVADIYDKALSAAFSETQDTIEEIAVCAIAFKYVAMQLLYTYDLSALDYEISVLEGEASK